MISDQVFLICQATRLSLRHKDMDTTRKEINAMEDLREKVDEVFSDENLAFPYSIFYLGWKTNKVRVKSRREKNNYYYYNIARSTLYLGLIFFSRISLPR